MGMLLRIIVGLIGIVGRRVGAISSSRGIFACGVIATVDTVDAIGGVLVHAIPTHACLLATSKKATNHLCFSAIPTKVAVVGVEVRGCAVEESVRVDFGESSVGSPMVR